MTNFFTMELHFVFDSSSNRNWYNKIIVENIKTLICVNFGVCSLLVISIHCFVAIHVSCGFSFCSLIVIDSNNFWVWSQFRKERQNRNTISEMKKILLLPPSTTITQNYYSFFVNPELVTKIDHFSLIQIQLQLVECNFNFNFKCKRTEQIETSLFEIFCFYIFLLV